MPQPESVAALEPTHMAATADTIAEQQLADGLILWTPGGHADVWNHTEAAMALATAGLVDAAERAYQWLADAQRPDGTWHHYYVEGGVEDAKVDTNCCAYVATGVWHHWLLTGDRGAVEALWPMVAAALDFVVSLQRTGGEIPWAVHVDGTPWSYSLLTGSSSIHLSLRCGLALAAVVGHERPRWELAAAELATMINTAEHRFEPKTRWAMDWYYPVLAGVTTDAAARDRLRGRHGEFVMDGLGVRCVTDQPWVTAAETCECVMAHLRVGDTTTARELFESVAGHRHDDGSYYTGTVHPDGVRFPDGERTTYSAAAVILAADALDRRSAASGLFGGVGPALS